MKNTFSLKQIPRTSTLDANLVSRQYKLDLMAEFMRNKYENLKPKPSEIPDRLGYSSSILKRYRNDINMVSPYRVQPKITNKRTKKTSSTNFDNNSNHDLDVKRHRLTSNDIKLTSKESSPEVKPVKSKNKVKNGANIEINEKYLDATVHNNYI